MLEPSGKRGVTETNEADYLALVVDSTRAGDLAELGMTLSLLPLSWWKHTAVVLTKGESHVEHAQRICGTALTALISTTPPAHVLRHPTLALLRNLHHPRHQADLRSRAAFRPQQLTQLVSSYSPTTLVFFSSVRRPSISPCTVRFADQADLRTPLPCSPGACPRSPSVYAGSH